MKTYLSGVKNPQFLRFGQFLGKFIALPIVIAASTPTRVRAHV